MTELYVVDETVAVDSTPESAIPLMENHPHSIRKLLEVGSICNNASEARNANGVYNGQPTDVALLNVLSSFGLDDMRQVLPKTIMWFLALMVGSKVIQPAI